MTTTSTTSTTSTTTTSTTTTTSSTSKTTSTTLATTTSATSTTTTSTTTTSTTTSTTTTTRTTTSTTRTTTTSTITTTTTTEIECPSGFDSVDGGCVDVDECQLDESACGPNADCFNFDGGYECYCIQGYVKDQNGDCQQKQPSMRQVRRMQNDFVLNSSSVQGSHGTGMMSQNGQWAGMSGLTRLCKASECLVHIKHFVERRNNEQLSELFEAFEQLFEEEMEQALVTRLTKTLKQYQEEEDEF